MKNKDVPELLEEKGKIFREKQKQYGSSYKDFGIIMNILMKNQQPKSENDWNKIGLYNMIVHKVMRLGKKLLEADVSIDSVQDLQVYGAILEKIINEER